MLEVSLQVFGGRKEHEVITCADREPGEREIRPDRFNRFAAVTYFNDQDAVFGQMIRGLRQQTAHHIHSVEAGFERERRLKAVFIRRDSMAAVVT